MEDYDPNFNPERREFFLRLGRAAGIAGIAVATGGLAASLLPEASYAQPTVFERSAEAAERARLEQAREDSSRQSEDLREAKQELERLVNTDYVLTPFSPDSGLNGVWHNTGKYYIKAADMYITSPDEVTPQITTLTYSLRRGRDTTNVTIGDIDIDEPVLGERYVNIVIEESNGKKIKIFNYGAVRRSVGNYKETRREIEESLRNIRHMLDTNVDNDGTRLKHWQREGVERRREFYEERKRGLDAEIVSLNALIDSRSANGWIDIAKDPSLIEIIGYLRALSYEINESTKGVEYGNPMIEGPYFYTRSGYVRGALDVLFLTYHPNHQGVLQVLTENSRISNPVKSRARQHQRNTR